MDTQHNTALTRALAEVPGPLPTSGVIHITLPHTDRFTVVGNHLAQHPDLSCTAVGLAVRIQSLPQGTEISIKALTARCQEGERRIAAALRELEAHGYLQRFRHRLPGQKVITRTVFCNQPAALLCPRSQSSQTPVAAPAPAPAPAQTHVQDPDSEPDPAPVPVPPVPAGTSRTRTSRNVRAGNSRTAPAALRTARAAPDRPQAAAPARPRVVVTPFQTCDDCDRAFRSADPGCCRDCRETRAAYAQAAA